MKKLLLIMAVFSAAYYSAQTFSDNFDSYTAGGKLAQQSAGAWTTWSNAPGGAEDGTVSNANAASAPNSVYFASDLDGGGPVDQVKNFGVLNTGQFSLEMNIFVETGKAAYFNLQKTATIGQVWALNANFNDDGTLTLDDASTINLSTNFTHNIWFNFRLDINFNTNVWEVFIDNVSKGSFANSINQIASIDIFPVDQNTPFSSGFYVDDFQYTITPYTLPQLNAGATFVSIVGPYLAGTDVTRKVKVRNLGLDAITSFDITTNYNGINNTQSFTGLNLASLAETEVTINAPMTLIAGNNVLTATVSNVNGQATDGDANDNSVTKNINPTVPAAGKMVVGEEGTGTWCGWCPRGTVAMDRMENKYAEFWAGIAVHNGDPMVVTDYDAAMASKISGYPSSLVDRGVDDDPSLMEPKFLDRITVAPTAFINNSAVWEPSTRTLTVTVSANFQASADSSYRLSCALTEDGITGGAGYEQANYYSSTSNNMDLIDDDGMNWKTLANPVPAAQMVYNHVARAILPGGFEGVINSFPPVVNANETHSQTFVFTLAPGWNVSNMHIIGMLIAPDGTIDNAGKATVSEAAAVAEATKKGNLLIYPNPTNKELNITYSNGKVDQINILTLDGKTVISKKITNNYLNTDVSTLKAGMYIVEVISQNNSTKEVFIKQ